MKRLNFTLLFAVLSPTLFSQTVPPPHAPHGGEVVFLDNYIVTVTPSARAQAELAQATTVLTGHALALRQQSSLGETLAFQPGISSTSFGPGASRPVIRGIGGERVRILENGAGSFDVAGLSPDHATSIEPLFAERIEIVRGPSALLFGSSAAGGVVNVIDGRIPMERPDGRTSGATELRGGSAADELAAVLRIRGGEGAFAWRAGAFTRDAGDVRIPSAAGVGHDGRLPNSFVTAKGGFAGATRFWDNGRAGAAVTTYATRYGAPGDEPVSIDLERRRLDIRAAAKPSNGWIDAAELDLAFSDYEHTEFEDGEIEAVFHQDSFEARLALPFSRRSGASGALGVQYHHTDLIVEGDHAFLPPSRTTGTAAFLHESHTVGAFILEAGARVEHQAIRPDLSGIAQRTDTTASGSAGIVWMWNEMWSLAASAARTTRPPTAKELFADGEHHAMGIYVIGSPDLLPEKGDSLELTLRKRRGLFSGAATVFSNRIDRFIFLSPTGEIDHGLPVFAHEQAPARFHGFEIETIVHLHGTAERGLDLKLGADSVRAVRRPDGEPLPGIPPNRLLAGLRYNNDTWTAGVDAVRASDQRRVATYETETDGYTLLGADLGWHLRAAGLDWRIILRGSNLLDRVARNHVSLLKDIAPLPGRSINVSVRAAF